MNNAKNYLWIIIQIITTILGIPWLLSGLIMSFIGDGILFKFFGKENELYLNELYLNFIPIYFYWFGIILIWFMVLLILWKLKIIQ